MVFILLFGTKTSGEKASFSCHISYHLKSMESCTVFSCKIETLVSYFRIANKENFNFLSICFFILLVFFQMNIDKSNLILSPLSKSSPPIILLYCQLYHSSILNLKTEQFTSFPLFQFVLFHSINLCVDYIAFPQYLQNTLAHVVIIS